MAKLRFFKPLVTYRTVRRARSPFRFDGDMIRHIATRMAARSGVLVACIHPRGVESTVFHTGDNTWISSAMSVLHAQCSAQVRLRSGRRIDWLDDRYHDAPNLNHEVLLWDLHAKLLRKDGVALIGGHTVFDGTNGHLLEPMLLELGVDAARVARFLLDLTEDIVEFEAAYDDDMVSHVYDTLDDEDELLAYAIERGAAVGRYREAARAWRAGLRNAVIPLEMFPPHSLRSSDHELEVPPYVHGAECPLCAPQRE